MKKISIITFLTLNIIAFNNGFSQNDSIVKLFPYKIGNLRFSTSQIYFARILNTETKSNSIKIYNEWDKEMKITLTGLPAFITAEVNPVILKPHEVGSMIITYITPKRNAWGYINDRISVTTNDVDKPTKVITISANITEDFSKLTPKELEEAPKIEFVETKHDFGTITKGSKVEYAFEFKNTGKTDLKIRQAKASCGCTAIMPVQRLIKPGETSSIKAIFNSTGKNGKQNKSITVVSNDPNKSVIHLHISAMVQ